MLGTFRCIHKFIRKQSDTFFSSHLPLCMDKTRSRKDSLYRRKKFCNFCHSFFIFFIHHWEMSVKMQQKAKPV